MPTRPPLPAPWERKAYVYRALAALPPRAGDALRVAAQTRLGRRVLTNPGAVSVRAQQAAARLLGPFGEWRDELRERSILEIGTGWAPVSPVVYWLAGFRDVTSVDIEPLYRARDAAHALAYLHPLIDGTSLFGLPLDPDRVELLGRVVRNGGDPVAAGMMEVRVSDVAHLAGEWDMTASDNTLEHIPATHLVRFLGSVRRLTGTATSHFVDASDHYSHGSSEVDAWNFLRYSEAEWQRFESRFLSQNRNRADDYARLFADAGFADVAVTLGPNRPTLPADLAAQFAGRDPDLVAALGFEVAGRVAAS